MEIFGMCSIVYMCSKSDRQHFVVALFHYTGTKDSVLDLQNPVLKLSNVLWLRESVEDRRMTKG